jgi:hypothetical protein
MLQSIDGNDNQPTSTVPVNRPKTLKRDDSESNESARAKESKEKILQTKLIVVELLQVIYYKYIFYIIKFSLFLM